MCDCVYKVVLGISLFHAAPFFPGSLYRSKWNKMYKTLGLMLKVGKAL